MEHIVLSRLADQVNFFPSFGFLSQISSLIDAMITATTGAKTGISLSREAEVAKILECVTIAFNNLVLNETRIRQIEMNKLESNIVDDSNVDYSHVPDIRYPVLIIDDFLDKDPQKGHYIYDLLAQWASTLAEQRLAHVVFISDNPSANRVLAKALPTRSVEVFQLADADPASALQYLKSRLPMIEPERLSECIKHLGGRFNDLDILIQKIQTGKQPEEATMEMINRAVAELRKLGLQEGVDEQAVGWTPIQFWKIAQLLCKNSQIPYDSLCIDPLFKNSVNSIQHLERAGIIALVHINNRPQSIKAGKPLFQTSFKTITSDKKESHLMEALTNQFLKSEMEKYLKKYEDEMKLLTELKFPSYFWTFYSPAAAVKSRLSFLTTMFSKASNDYQKFSERESAAKKKLQLE
jgi:hypothetical protein